MRAFGIRKSIRSVREQNNSSNWTVLFKLFKKVAVRLQYTKEKSIEV